MGWPWLSFRYQYKIFCLVWGVSGHCLNTLHRILCVCFIDWRTCSMRCGDLRLLWFPVTCACGRRQRKQTYSSVNCSGHSVITNSHRNVSTELRNSSKVSHIFSFNFYPTAIHGCAGIVFILDGRAAAAILSGLDLCNHKLEEVQTWHTGTYHGLVVQCHGQTRFQPLTLTL